MRIAVTGTHGSGKATPIDDFISAYGDYESVPEPCWLRAQNGIPFADGPTTADLEEQVGQSRPTKCTVRDDGASLLTERCVQAAS